MSKALYTFVYSAFFLLPCNGSIVSAEAVKLYCMIVVSVEYKRLSNRLFAVL